MKVFLVLCLVLSLARAGTFQRFHIHIDGDHREETDKDHHGVVSIESITGNGSSVWTNFCLSFQDTFAMPLPACEGDYMVDLELEIDADNHEHIMGAFVEIHSTFVVEEITDALNDKFREAYQTHSGVVFDDHVIVEMHTGNQHDGNDTSIFTDPRFDTVASFLALFVILFLWMLVTVMRLTGSVHACCSVSCGGKMSEYDIEISDKNQDDHQFQVV